MPLPSTELVEIAHAGSSLTAQKAAKAFARKLGFADLECEEIAIVASELANNMIKHANGGSLKFTSAASPDRTGIQIVAEDRGPGISAAEEALTDGYSTGGGLGVGLGAVHRLMDELDIDSPPAGGTRVVCRRWLGPSEKFDFARKLEFGVASRPRRGETENGDKFIVKSWQGHALAGVIDGLGHGHHAHLAAQSVRNFIEDHYDTPLADLFSGANRVCRGSRGVVMALARFDLAASMFDMAILGNVEARHFGTEKRPFFTVRRGIVGVNAPAPIVTTHPWLPQSVLVIHSDGLRSHWEFSEFPACALNSSPDLAIQLMRSKGKTDDDATILVVRNRQ